MSYRRYAKSLGRRGGKRRAQKLSSQERKAIASLGGEARSEALKFAKRVEENFRYLKAIRQLA